MSTTQCQIRRTSTSTTTNGSSQPDSLDLEMDYDMWQGQFEFSGDSNGDTQSIDSVNRNQSEVPSQYLNHSNNQPILIDEETFLSLHPNDFDEFNSLESSLPKEYLIRDAIDNLHLVPDNNNECDLIENKVLTEHNKNQKLLNDNLSVEELNNIKNTLIMHNEIKKTDNFPVHRSNSNGFTTELCENLNEQVGVIMCFYICVLFFIILV